MKVTTDPQTGVTSCELEKPDRNRLAAAKTVLEKLGYHMRGTEDGTMAGALASGIGMVLSGEVPAATPEGN